MYSLHTNNRFGHLDYDDENEENVETPVKPAADAKKPDNKKDNNNAKKPSKPTAAVPPAKVTSEKIFNESPPKQTQGRQFSQQEKPFGAPLTGNNDNNRRPRPAIEGGFGGNRGGGGSGGGAPAFVGNRGGGRGGGAGGRSGDDNRGKREFDRRSGMEKSGVKASDKREGAGAHNWGNSIKDFTTETFAPPADGEAENEEKPATEEKPVDDNGEGVPPAESQVAHISLDEYLSQKEKTKVELPARPLRKAGEGEGSFSGVKIGKKIQKSKDDGEEKVKIVEERGSGRVKKVLEVSFPSMANRGRGGGRRGGRGNYGGGMGGRDSKPNQPDILDPSAFPALSQ